MQPLVTRARVLLVTLLLLVSSLPGPAVAQNVSLYERLGGMTAIEAVVDQFLANVAGDTRINSFFAGTDLPRLRTLLVEQICQGSGGPCTYTGRNMADTHRGMGVTQAHFGALVEDLVMALDAFSVPDAEKNELLGLLGPMASDIVDTSLYARLGGRPAIEAVVDQFLTNVAADNRINRFFAGTDLPRLRTLLVEQICQGAGGPCTYTGRNMSDTHRGMGITGADFSALVEDLIMALDTFSVPLQERSDLLGLLGPMQSDIVETPAPRVTPTTVPSTAVPVATPAPAPTAAPQPTASAQPASVTISNFSFNLNALTVPVGTTVTWTNQDTTPHTVTGSGFDSSALNRGQTFSNLFSAAGTFTYQCRFHSNMRGTITVQ